MRDRHDNCVVVCSIENLDPMGVHTGDSITVAPAMTLTDREYQTMRDMAFAVIREVGVETGGSNIQFAVDPQTGRQVVIEMNPRVSRSSALASKATGFPIAKIAAKLALGYTLDEIPNDITAVTPASFEPSLDYVVVKIPRFAFEKFPGADTTLTTHMKSVGEVMALGRSFPEALQKAVRSLEAKGAELDVWSPPGDKDGWLAAGRRGRTTGGCRPSCRRCVPARPPRRYTTRTSIDPWFLDQLGADPRGRRRGPRRGRSSTPARCAGRSGTGSPTSRSRGCAAGWVRTTSGGCVTRSASGRSTRPSTPARPSSPPPRRTTTPPTTRRTRSSPATGPKVIILGSGPNRIGQGVEFDYSCVHACYALHDAGLRDRDGQLQPGDGLDRLRHLRPAVLRAAHLRGRARGRRGRAAQRRGRRRRRPARRPDPARPRPAAQGRRRPDRRDHARGDPPGRGARRLRPGARRRPGWRRRVTAPRAPTTTRSRSPPRSATPSWSGRRTCWAVGAWRSCTTTATCATTSTGPPRSRPSTRCWSTASSTTRSRSTSTRSTTAPSCSSAA